MDDLEITDELINRSVGLDLTATMNFGIATLELVVDDVPLDDDLFISRETLDEISLEEQIGEGGMGAVFSATQSFPERKVAIKKLKGSRKSLVDRLLKEAQITGRLEHPNIIPVYQVRLDEQGQPEVIFRKVEGVNLREVLNREPQSGEKLLDILQLLIQVCHAVEYAHSMGILHRDIKPENIMIGEFNQVYLMDWGIAVDMNDLEANKMGIVGTPVFMAPEMRAGDPRLLSEATDVYLMGATLHQVLTGAARNEAESIEGVLEKLEQDTVYLYPISVPKGLAMLCNAACAKNPEHRPQTIAEFRDKLEDYLYYWSAVQFEDAGLEKLKEYKEEWEASVAYSNLTKEAIDQSSLYQISDQAKYFFERALEIWPESSRAKEGLSEVVILMIEQALVGKEVMRAESLYAEYLAENTADLELVRRIEKAKREWENEQEQIEQIKKRKEELDPQKTFAPRFLLRRILFLCSAGTLVVLTAWSILFGQLTGADQRLYPLVLSGIPCWITMGILWKRLTVNEFGKQAVRMIIFITLGILINTLAGMKLNSGVSFMNVMDCVIFAVVLSNATTIFEKAVPVSISCVFFAVAAILFPEQNALFPAICSAIVAGMIYIEWGKVKYISEEA